MYFNYVCWIKNDGRDDVADGTSEHLECEHTVKGVEIPSSAWVTWKDLSFYSLNPLAQAKPGPT